MKYRIPKTTRLTACLLVLLACWSSLVLATPVATPSSSDFTWSEDTDVNSITAWNLNDIFKDPGHTLTFINPPADLGPDALVTASVDSVTGIVTFTTNGDANGDQTLVFTAQDEFSDNATYTMNIRFSPANDVTDDSFGTSEDVLLVQNVSGNDSFSGAVAYSVNSDVSDGTLALAGDGSFTYTPDPDFNGSDNFTYDALDVNGDTETGKVAIVVSAVDDAQDDTFATLEDTVLNEDVSTNDTYTGLVTYAVNSAASNGLVALAGDGTFSYTPDADFNGTDGFTYDVTDGNGDTETQAVLINVSAADDAQDDSFGTAEDIAISDDVSINDTYTGVATYAVNTPASNGAVAMAGDGTFTYTPNGDFNGSDSFTYNATDVNSAVETQTVSITVGGVLDALDDAFSTTEDTVLNEDVSTNDTYTGVVTYTVNTDVTDGTLALAGDGTFSYTPNADFNGVDGFTYDATDVNGAVETQSVTINVSAADDAQDDTFATAEDTLLNENVSTNDGYAGAATYTVNTDVTDGTLALAGDGTFTYTPNADFNGADGFTYDATDVNGAVETQMVTINVSAADDAQDDTFATAEDTVLNENVSTNDGYAGAASYAVNADVTNGVLVLAGDGSFSYTPDPDFNGVDTFTYDATDVNAAIETQAVTINVGAVNDAPTAVDDSYAAVEDTALTVSAPGVLANDGDVDGDSPVVDSNTAAANGTVVVNADGSFTYTPGPDFNGVDSFDYTLDDGNGGTDAGTVTINVSPINDLPVGIDDSYATDEDVALVISAPGVLGNDTDVDGDGVTVIGDTGATNGTLTVNVDGSFTYTPNADFNGVDGFDYTVDDGNGGTDTGSVTITVNAVNDLPVAVDESYVTDEDAPLSVPAPGVLANDSDVDGEPLTIASNTNTSDGVLSVSADGSFTYTPNADFNGVDGFQYTVDDGVGGTAIGSVTITVNSINDDPVPVDDTYITDEDVTINISAPGLLLNDSDVDGDPLTIVSNTNTSDGVLSVNADGSFSYNPKKNFNGADSFQYTVEDGAGGSATATVVITVSPVNDIPAPLDDIVSMSEDGGTIVIPVLLNDYLAEEPTTVTAAGVGGVSESAATVVLNQGGDAVSIPNGTVTIVGDTVEYRPKDDFYGTDYFTYTITDADGDIGTATVTVTVSQQNDPPTGIQFRSFSMLENSALTVDASNGVLANAYDVDGALLDAFGNPIGEPLSIQPVTLPPVGTLLLNKFDGTFTYTPPVNFTGDVSFTYRLFDDQSFSEGDAYQVSISVFAAPAPAAPPPAGEVAITYSLANVPLEQSTSVPPNVLVVMDDSGSMDWNMIVAGADEQGGFLLDNNAIARNRSDAVSFVYLWDLKTNAYPPSSEFGRILPTDEALAADSDTDNNQYGTWRARTHLHNKMYYNPQNYYAPWIGQDALNVEFADADPSAVRLDPVDPGATFDLLAPHSFDARGVPEWDNNGGTETVDVEDMYIPHYYTTTSLPPLAWNDPNKQRVEIKPGAGPLSGMFPGGFNREDCAVGDNNPLDCTYDQEIQNFANYFQYYRSREYVTKSGMGRVISQLQDIRVGYETISATTSEPVRDMNDLYTEGNKKALMDNVYAVDSYGGTPLRQALGRAGKILGCDTGNDCPRLPDPEGFCQQNFALLFSDGYWNGGAGVPGNDDVDGPRPFDGGRYADGVKATLADVAMFYYENDIHPDFDDQVPVSARDVLGAPPGTFAPNDPVMHQHMKTYAIAFGVSGSVNPAAIPSDPTVPFAWPDPFDGPLEKIDDMLHTAVNGRGRFLNAGSPQELQAAFEAAFLEFTQAASSTSSAAFNSTSLRDGTLLYRGFYDLRDNTGELTATRVNNDGSLQPVPQWRASEQLEPAITLPGSRVLVTYDKASRKGIPFRHVDLTPDQQLTINDQQVNFIRGDRANEAPAGPLRERAPTGALLGDIVNSSPVFVGEPRSINRDQAPYPITDLYSEFADAKKDRTPVVYVGANDGIMHGFDATTGREIFGYVPNKILDVTESYRNTLDDFTSPFYQHKYYVDLTPRLNDAYMRGSPGAVSKSWNSIMIGGLGAGGKGFFALNVTDPDTDFASEAAAESAVLWEFTDSDDTYPVNGAGVPLGGAVGAITDPLGKPVKDLGYSLSLPTLAMSNVEDGGSPAEKEWVAVFGNGPNSTAGIAKLFVLFVDRGLNGWGDADDFVKIDTGFGVPVAPNQLAGFPNGLGTPAAVDRNLDGTVDWVYAGDRLGNLYRFDLSDPNPDNWKSTRLFTATYFDGAVDRLQPILSQPLVIKHPTEQGFLVIFGTGSYLTKEDASSEEIQSIYAIWDRGDSSPPTALADTKSLRLVEQTITNVVDDSLVPQVTRRVISKDPVNYLAESGVPGTYGWYIDLDMPRAASTQSGAVNPDSSGRNPPDAQFPGERAIRRLLFRDGTIITTTVLPSLDEFSCFGTRPGAILLFDAVTGGDPGRAVVDFNTDGVIDEDDMVDVAGELYAAGVLFDQQDLDGSLVDLSTLGGEGDTDFLFVSGGSDTVAYRIEDINDSRTGRLSWRELDQNQ